MSSADVSDASAGDDASDEDAAEDAVTEAIPEPTCDEYCAKISAACPGVFGQAGAKAQCASDGGCENTCEQIGSGDYSDMAGTDSIGCRLNQLLPGGAGCTAAGATGGGVCNEGDDAGDDGRCYTFCSLTLAQCTLDDGVNPQPYPDMDTCLAECGTKFLFDPTQPEYTTSGNTLNCRQYYLVLAYDASDDSSAIYQCPHLGWPATAFCE